MKKIIGTVSYFAVVICGPAHAQTLPTCDVKQIVSWQFGVANRNVAEASTSSPEDDNFARALAVDRQGNMYVADGVNYELLKFGARGDLLWKKPLSATSMRRPDLGYVISSIAIDRANHMYILKETERKVDVYTTAGEFVRVFTVRRGNQLYVTADNRLLVCDTYKQGCKVEVGIGSGGYVAAYTLDGEELGVYQGKDALDLVSSATLVGRTDYALTDRYDTPDGACATFTKSRKPLASCVGFPANRNEHYVFDDNGVAYSLNDEGIFKAAPRLTDPVLLKDLPNYRSDCRRKLGLDSITIDELIEKVFTRELRDLSKEDPELRHYLLRQRPEDLRLLRNAVVARANYAFNDDDLKRYFTQRFPTYRPVHKDPSLSLSDTNEAIYIREIEEKVLGKSLDAAYPKYLVRDAKMASKRGILRDKEVLEVKESHGTRHVPIAGSSLVLYRSPRWDGVRKGDTLRAFYSPDRAYAVLHGSNTKGANLWVVNLSGLGVEFHTTQYEGQPLEIRWKDASSFAVTFRFPKAESRTEATWGRKSNLWYKPSEWMFVTSSKVD